MQGGPAEAGPPCRLDYSTSLPTCETSRMSASISVGIVGIGSRTAPAVGDHTRFTCSAGSSSG